MPLNDRDFFLILVKFEVTPQFREQSTNLCPSRGGIFLSILVHFEECWETAGCWGPRGLAPEVGPQWDGAGPSALGGGPQGGPQGVGLGGVGPWLRAPRGRLQEGWRQRVGPVG